MRNVQDLMRYAGCTALAAAVIVLAAGCAKPVHTNPTDRVLSVDSATPSPPNLTKSPPDSPTDLRKPNPWIVGTVTAGGTGPCYGLETDEGVQYALHSTAGTRLDRGTRIRVKTTPARVRINCGPGKLLEMTVAEPVR
jgi:hypothetical protein